MRMNRNTSDYTAEPGAASALNPGPVFSVTVTGAELKR